MPKVRLLAPWTDKNGNPYAPGGVADVDDETFAELRADGKASSVEDEEKAAEAAKTGNFNARTGRDEAGGTVAEDPPKAAKAKS